MTYTEAIKFLDDEKKKIQAMAPAERVAYIQAHTKNEHAVARAAIKAHNEAEQARAKAIREETGGWMKATCVCDDDSHPSSFSWRVG